MRFVVFILLLFTLNIFPQTGAVGDEYLFKVNNIQMPMDNRGILGDVDITSEKGGYFRGSRFLFSGGFILGGYYNEQLLVNGVASSALSRDYEPGEVGGSFDENAMIYVIDKDDPEFGKAWKDWKNAVDLGAEFYDGNKNGIYEPYDLNFNGKWDENEDAPVIFGTRTAFCVYNDSKPQSERFGFDGWVGPGPVGIEVRQYVYAYETDEKPLSNVLYVDYEFINKNPQQKTLTEMIYSIWADFDLGYDFNDELVGCDPQENTCFVYQNSSEIDFSAMISLQSPGYENSNYSSFLNFDYDYNIDYDYLRLYRGFQFGYGAYVDDIDPCDFSQGNNPEGCDTLNCKYWYSGDPVSGAGWLNIREQDQRVMMNIGPEEFPYGASKRIRVAYIIGQRNTSLESVEDAREIAKVLKGDVVNTYVNNERIYPEGYRLEQNYPNPFNPQTTIRFTLPEETEVTLKLTNILGKTKYILNNLKLAAGTYDYPYDASDLPTGVYFYTLVTEKYRSTKKMLLIR